MPLSDHGTLHLKKRVTCKYTEWTRLTDTCEFHRTLKDGGDSSICDNENVRKCEPCTNGPWSAWERRESVRKCESRRWREVFIQENGTQYICSEENEDSHCNDCALGGWSEWVESEKSAQSNNLCFEKRVRPILVYPSTGGHVCQKANDSRACPQAEDEGLSPPSIAGITIGSSILLIAVVVFICCCIKSAWRKSGHSADASKLDSNSKSNSSSHAAARRRKKSDPERRKSVPKPPKPVCQPPEEISDYYTAPVVTDEPARESNGMIISGNESERYYKAADPGADSVYHEIYKLDCDVGYETGSERNPPPLEFAILSENGYSETTYLDANNRRSIRCDSNVVYALPERKRTYPSKPTQTLGPDSSDNEVTLDLSSENDSNSIDYSTPRNDQTYDVLKRPRVNEPVSSPGTSNSNYHKISAVAQETKEGPSSPGYSMVDIIVNPNHVEDNDDYSTHESTVIGNYIKNREKLEIPSVIEHRAKLEIPSATDNHDYHVVECDNLAVGPSSGGQLLNSNNNNTGNRYHLMNLATWRDGDLSRRSGNNSVYDMEVGTAESAHHRRALELPVLKKIRSKHQDSGVRKINSVSRSTKC